MAIDVNADETNYQKMSQEKQQIETASIEKVFAIREHFDWVANGSHDEGPNRYWNE